MRCICLLAMVLMAGAVILRAGSIEDVQAGLSSPDASVRATAIDRFAMSLGTVQGRAYWKPAEPIFIRTLGDANSGVREGAAEGLILLAAVSSRIIRPPNPNLPDLAADPAAKPALTKAIFDSDEGVRLSALKAYAATFPLTPEIEDQIITEFHAPDSKTNDPGDKSALIECLILSRHPSPKAEHFLTSLLVDPKYGVHVAERLAADQVPLSQDALEPLLARLEQSLDEVSRDDFARAIGFYGESARAYLPRLNAALLDEKSAMVKASIQATIDKVNR